MFTLSAPAKINLALDVLRRRTDGYHEVDMVMQTISLADQILFEPCETIKLSCNHQKIPEDQRNLAWKAAQLLQEEFKITDGIKITITKNIPVAAGLAGGSTDAATVLMGLNRLWDLHMTQRQLMDFGVRLGADVPFCIMRKTARAQGIGTNLTPIASLLKCKVFLVTPNIEVSTPFVYNHLQVDQIHSHPQIDGVVEAIKAENMEQLTAGWGNVLEKVVTKHWDEVRWLKALFLSHGIAHCLMSGSGPSVFALNPPLPSIDAIVPKLPKNWFHCYTEFM